MKHKFQEGQINQNGCKLKWTKLDKLRVNLQDKLIQEN